jgi:hypothetical protein
MISRLCKAFEAQNRFFKLKPKKPQLLRDAMRNKRIDVMYDCVGSNDGVIPQESRPRPGAECVFVVSMLNDCGFIHQRQWHDAVAVDQGMLKACGPDSSPDDAKREDVLVLSCWQSCMYEPYLESVDQHQRAQRTTFNIFCPVPLNRIDEELLSLIWMLLFSIDQAVIIFYANPMYDVKEVEDKARIFAAEKELDPEEFVRKRIVMWFYLPMVEHLRRIREEVDVAIAYGNYPAHTAAHTVMLAGRPVVAVEGLSGGGGLSGHVPASMNVFVGLGALTVANGTVEEVEAKVLSLLKQLHREPHLLDAICNHLDSLRRGKRALCDPDRCKADVLLGLELLLAQDGPRSIINCATCNPESPLLATDAEGKLKLAAQGAADLTAMVAESCGMDLDSVWQAEDDEDALMFGDVGGFRKPLQRGSQPLPAQGEADFSAAMVADLSGMDLGSGRQAAAPCDKPRDEILPVTQQVEVFDAASGAPCRETVEEIWPADHQELFGPGGGQELFGPGGGHFMPLRRSMPISTDAVAPVPDGSHGATDCKSSNRERKRQNPSGASAIGSIHPEESKRGRIRLKESKRGRSSGSAAGGELPAPPLA